MEGNLLSVRPGKCGKCSPGPFTSSYRRLNGCPARDASSSWLRQDALRARRLMCATSQNLRSEVMNASTLPFTCVSRAYDARERDEVKRMHKIYHVVSHNYHNQN